MKLFQTLHQFWRESFREEKVVFFAGALILPVWLGHEYSMTHQPALPPMLHDVPSTQTQQLRVHVVGAVKKPALLALRSGARVNDAIQKAGGATVRADLNALNLAAPLHDGQQIVVPVRGAQQLREHRVRDALAPRSKAHPTPTTVGPININTATAQELEALPGVGPAIAQRIVEERMRQPFTSLQDVNRVKGIGPVKLQRMAPYITF